MNLRSTPGLSYYLWVGFSLILIFTALKPAGTEGTGILIGLAVWAIQISLLLPLLIGLHMSLQSINIFNESNPWLKLTVSGLAGCRSGHRRRHRRGAAIQPPDHQTLCRKRPAAKGLNRFHCGCSSKSACCLAMDRKARQQCRTVVTFKNTIAYPSLPDCKKRDQSHKTISADCFHFFAKWLKSLDELFCLGRFSAAYRNF